MEFKDFTLTYYLDEATVNRLNRLTARWMKATNREITPQPRGPSWSILPGCGQGLLRPLFGPAAMLVDLDCGAVQHQGGLINDVLGNQLPKDMLPHSLPAPAVKTGIHTFPGAVPFRQVSPGYPCIRPVQNPVQHDPVTLSRPSSVYRFFRRQQVLAPIPLSFG